jgi:hypothetical protein
MPEATTAPVATLHPKPTGPMPPRIGQVLGLLRMLIAYGNNLAETLESHASQPHLLPFFGFVATMFRSKDVAQILARIRRGLLRAALLEERLRKRADRGRDIQPLRIRAPRQRKPRAARPAASLAHDSRLPPTDQQIAAQVRHRSIGAVLVDICLDLGIIAGQMDPASWNDLGLALALYGGDLSNLVVWRQPRPRAGRRPRDPSFLPVSIPGQTGMTFPPWPAPSSGLSTGCTGPP